MLVCGSCNRSKSWTCEACENWQAGKDPEVCKTCMWGSPEDYTHVAMEARRTLTIAWQGDDVDAYDELREDAAEAGMEPADYAREALKRSLE